MELNQLEKFFASESDKKDVEIRDCFGSSLITTDGREIIDFTSGWCVGNLGWKNREVEKALKSFSGPSYVSPHFEYAPWKELAALLAKIAPGHLQKSFRATGGTEAVEIALQAAKAHTGRNKFIAIEGAYHGNSIATRGLISDSPYFEWKRLAPPLDGGKLNELEEILKEKQFAAFIMEPIICNLGVLIPDSQFMNGLEELCHRYGTLLIMDEVASGFGRTGKMFATQHFKLKPDIMCLGKALSGGAAAIGATIMTEEVASSLQEENFPYSTFGWHPLSVAATIANIQFMQKNWNDLSENIRSMNEYFRQRLYSMNFDSEFSLNAIGLALGLKFNKEDYAEELSSRAFENGLLLSEGSLFPALNIDFDTAQRGLDILEETI